MTPNYANFYSIGEVLADVLLNVGDADMRLLTPGFYRTQVKYAMDELGFDTLFYDMFEDIEMPDDLILEMPKGAYNILNLTIFKGTPENMTNAENVYWRRGAVGKGYSTGVTARVNLGSSGNDPFVKIPSIGGGVYYFATQNGVIRLSDSCKGFDFARIHTSGIPSMLMDEVKIVPPEARKAISLWVTEKAAGTLKVNDAKYRTLQIDAVSQLDEYGYNGAWHQAVMRMKELDKKKLRDVLEYNAKLNA
jgi:hypothetical protein